MSNIINKDIKRTKKKVDEELMNNIDVEKRNMINFLEQDRKTKTEKEAISDAEKLSYLYGVLKNRKAQAYLKDLSARLDSNEEQENELRIARETSQMLEETLENFEGKILDSIADNGKLHQKIDSLEHTIMDLRIRLATVTRQRDSIKEKANEMNGQIDLHRRALSASEREITYLNARLHVERTAK